MNILKMKKKKDFDFLENFEKNEYLIDYFDNFKEDLSKKI